MKADPYDPIASYYDFLSQALGKPYRESKTLFLEMLEEGDKVLYLGGGTGRNLPVILERIGESGKIIYIEAASRMIEQAEKSIPLNPGSRVIFLHQSDFSAIPLESFDVVITQYLLDILPDEDIDQLFQQITKRTDKRSRWVFVDFFEVSGKRWLVKLMIRFFRFFTGNPRKDLPNYEDYFIKNGWQIYDRKSLDKGFIQGWLLKRTEIAQAMDE